MCAHQISINGDGGGGGGDGEKNGELNLDIENHSKITNNVVVNGEKALNMEQDSPPYLDSVHFSHVPEYDVGLLVDERITNQMSAEKSKAKRRKTKKYYQQQLELIESYKKDDKFMQKFVENDEASYEDEDEPKNLDKVLTTATLVVNICLFIGKIIAAILSGSLVVISSVIDSAMDLTTGAVIFATSRAIKRRDITKYPRGRTRLEPLALIVISVIMGAANVQVRAPFLLQKKNQLLSRQTTVFHPRQAADFPRCRPPVSPSADHWFPFAKTPTDRTFSCLRQTAIYSHGRSTAYH